MPGMREHNLLTQSVTSAVNESVMNGQHSASNGNGNGNGHAHRLSHTKRSKSLAMNLLSKSLEIDDDDEQESPPISRHTVTQIPGPVPDASAIMRSQSVRASHGSRSQNNSPRFSQSHAPPALRPVFRDSSSSPHSSEQKEKEKERGKRARFSTNEVAMRKAMHSRHRGSNYLESVVVIKIFALRVHTMIEVVLANKFKIRCTPTHLFWIVGKGWGCFDVQTRQRIKKKKTQGQGVVHQLREGEQLLTISGKKHRIESISVKEKPSGVDFYSILVAKNDCFFANDLLVKNSLE